MTTEAKTETTPGADGAPKEGTAGGKSADDAPKTPPTGQQGGQAAKPATSQQPKGDERTPKRATLKDDQDADELPDDVELIEMTPRGLKSRLTRHTKKELRDRFGTDSLDEIAAKLKKAGELEAKAEEDRRKQLTEQELVKEDLAKEKKLRAEAEARAEQVEEERSFERVEGNLAGILGKHFKATLLEDEDFREGLLKKVARNIRDNASEYRKLGPAQRTEAIDKWAKEYVTAHPDQGREEPKQQQHTPTVQRPFTNGTRPDKPAAGAKSGELANKTFAPGKPNSMTTTEARAAAKAEGYQW